VVGQADARLRQVRALEQVEDELLDQAVRALRLLRHFEVVDGVGQLLQVVGEEVARRQHVHFVLEQHDRVLVVDVHLVHRLVQRCNKVNELTRYFSPRHKESVFYTFFSMNHIKTLLRNNITLPLIIIIIIIMGIYLLVAIFLCTRTMK